MTDTADHPPSHGQAPLSRRRGGLAATRGGHAQAERTFFCRICQRVERGLWVPAGWYLLERAPGGQGRHLRLGLYCSLACLMNAAELLTQGAVEHAGRLGLATEAQQARDRARVLEVAQRLLEGGMTLRQAAESLEVPTFTLRTWLHAAGIRLGGDVGPAAATGTHPAPPRRPAAQTPSQPAPTTGGQQPFGRSPVSRVNELAQQRLITGLRWEIHTDGPLHRQTFTCTVTATPTATTAVVTASGTGTSKATAKANAAHALLIHLQATATATGPG